LKQIFKLDSSGHGWYKWILKYWWNFGYNKEYILTWTPLLFLLFLIINVFIIKTLNGNVYKIKSIPNSFPSFVWNFRNVRIKENLKLIGGRLWYSTVYTAAIFFKVTLQVENFKFKHKLGTIYLVLIYIVGLICIAYLVNFIIQK